MDLFIVVLSNFVTYSLLGWGLENVYCYYKTGSFQQDSFLSSPFKPMYGFSMCLLVICHKYFYQHGLIMALLCLIVPTSVEYSSGYLLKSIFNKMYWDYSMLKYNFQGLISLRFSIYWMVICFATLYLLQPIINRVYEMNMEIFEMITPFIIISMLVDFLVTIIRMTKGILLK